MMPLEEQINGLIDLHQSIYDAERKLGLNEGRSNYMRYLVEMTLLEEGHPLKGIQHLSTFHVGFVE